MRRQSVYFYLLGLSSVLLGLFCLRRVMVPSRHTKTPEAPRRCTDKPLSSQEHLAKRAMSNVRLDNIHTATEAMWGDGCGLPEMLAGRGRTSPSSCTSLKESRVDTQPLKIPSRPLVACYSSWPSGGTAQTATAGRSTPSTLDKTSTTDTSYS